MPRKTKQIGKNTKDGGGIQSLERAFGILERVAAHDEGVGLAELSTEVGLHNSTVFHLIRTMVQLGYARQDPGTKRYHLGRMVFSLAASSLTEIQLVSAAGPILDELARDTGESCHLGIQSGDEVVVVARSLGTGAFQMNDRAGSVRPAHATALGKVLFSFLPPDRLEAYLQRATLAPMTPRTIINKADLKREFTRVRRAVQAHDDGEYNTEVRCVAMPVFDFTGQVIAAIGVSGPIWRMTPERMPDISSRVRIAAEQLSIALGARVAA